MNYYNIGATIRLKGTFKSNDTGQTIDPQEVHFDIEHPGNFHKTYTYGIDPEIVRLEQGIYYMEIVGREGFYGYKVYSDAGVIAASEEGEFFVK